jgi:glyoxylase I family protein
MKGFGGALNMNKPLIKGVHHVSIKASVGRQYEETIRFYEDILGMQVIRTWGQGENAGVMFESGNGILEVFATNEKQLPKGAIRHFALATDDVDECIRLVREAGYQVFFDPKDIVIESEPRFPVRIAFCIGPAGEEIEFFQEL